MIKHKCCTEEATVKKHFRVCNNEGEVGGGEVNVPKRREKSDVEKRSWKRKRDGRLGEKREGRRSNQNGSCSHSRSQVSPNWDKLTSLEWPKARRRGVREANENAHIGRNILTGVDLAMACCTKACLFAVYLSTRCMLAGGCLAHAE